MNRILRVTIFLIIFISGFIMLIYPNLRQTIGQAEMETIIREFDTEEKHYDQLYYQMQEYNERIYAEHQSGLKDAWSYEENEFDFSEINTDSDMVGYITIDAMDISLPLYVGATFENMEKGAAILGQTSMPIGGNNTNCVIAAHRGGYTSALFRDIENLQLGDIIEITNPWEKLEYEVVKYIAIDDEDIEAVKIIDNSDMITLMSCHPYPHNYQRYVVYAQRVGSEEKVEIVYEGESYVSSKDKLKTDAISNKIGIASFVAIILMLLISVVISKKAKYKQHKKDA